MSIRTLHMAKEVGQSGLTTCAAQGVRLISTSATNENGESTTALINKTPAWSAVLALPKLGSKNYGRVEVLIEGQWGTICDHKWDINDAAVVCHQLGFKGARNAHGGAKYGQGSGPIHRNLVRCMGDEKSLLDCPYGSSRYCSHAEDAGVDCAI